MKSLSDFITASRLFGASGEHPGVMALRAIRGALPLVLPGVFEQTSVSCAPGDICNLR
jgi:hypothetical protein